MTTLAAQPSGGVRYATAAQWWEALGEVPLDRIVFDPWPGTATEADVLRLDDHEDRLCELIDGTLVEKTMGYDESAIAAEIVFLLRTFVKPRQLGTVTGEAGMLRILPSQIRIPDVAFVSVDRLHEKVPGARVPALAPDLAVEVLSDSNTRREMQNKLRDYFTAGTRLVWYVDPETRSVDVYTSPESVTHLTPEQTLTGGDVLPGFSVVVAELFEVG